MFRSDPVLDTFSCEDTDGVAETCLRNCFAYPAQDAAVDCNGEASFVSCGMLDYNFLSSMKMMKCLL